MAVDITNHLIPYTQVKRMLEQAWDEGYDAGELDAMDNLSNEHHDCTPNPYRDN